LIEIVNGYICMNCCDVDKARMGQDPHQSTNQIQKEISRQFVKLAPGNFGPAVTFGGSLQTTTTGAAAVSGSTSPTSQNAQAPQNASGPVLSSSVDLIA
jgi:hypothetical protein